MLFAFSKLITEPWDTLSREEPKRICEANSCPAQDNPKKLTENFSQALLKLWQSWDFDYFPGEPGKSPHGLFLCPPACTILGSWTHSQPLLGAFCLQSFFICPILPFLQQQQLQPSVILSQCPEGGGGKPSVFQVFHSVLWSDLEQGS